MNYFFSAALTLILLCQSTQLQAQCTPVNCLASLPSYGGICDVQLADGTVGTLYSDFESFHFTDVCFDVGSISPPNAGTYVKLTMVDNFTFSGLPAGMTGSTNAASYVTPANGCTLFQGVPTEAGTFTVSINMLLDGTAFPFSSVCTGFSIAQSNTPYSFQMNLKVNPDPSFSIPATTFCLQDGAVNLTETGTSGGTFSGPGISGSSFDPAVAGVGTHTIWYHVTAQQGAATGPATDSSSISVTVTAPTNSYYVDADYDTYGDENASAVLFCTATAPSGYSVNNLDCDDNDGAIHPGALEIPSNSIDEDCDGADLAIDNDLDSYDNTVDCDDNNDQVNPGATEVCDGIDNNCDGNTDEGFTINTYFEDGDNDGFGNALSTQNTCAVTAPPGFVTDNTDCDDNNSSINPGAAEICDGIDNDCSGTADDGLTIVTYYLDGDLDGYGVASSTLDTCLASPPIGYAAQAGDCNDINPNVNPGSAEICDGIDNDCVGGIDDGLTLNLYYQDNDNDGFGNPAVTTTNCGAVPGYVGNNQDCDDTDDLINPNATDAFGNSIDENCDGVDGVVGIDEQATGLSVELFPNPASATITLSGKLTTELAVRIFSMQGGMVSETTVSLNESCQLDVAYLKPGSYFVQITDMQSGASGVLKLMINR